MPLARRPLDRDRGRRGGGGGRRWLVRLLLLAAGVYAALFAWTGHLVGNAETAFDAGRYDEAHALLERAAGWRVRAGRVNDGLGVVDLARGRPEEAEAHLAAARRGFFHPAAFGEERVLRDLLREGRYEPARTYGEHRLAVAPGPMVAWYLGVAENGLNDLDAAERHLQTALADPAWNAKADEQLRGVAGKRRTGRADTLVDRNGTAIEAIDVHTGRPVELAPDLMAWLAGPAGPHLEPQDRNNRVELTLDLGIQRAAEAALGSQRGALVVLDVATGGLLAAASQPRVDPQTGRPVALTGTFEPGSILKLLTLAAALRSGADVSTLFPMDCPGWITIDGQIFRDWRTHGEVGSIEEAVSVSCNIAFARIGALAGRDALSAELRHHGFDPALPPGGAGASDFDYSTGRLLPEDTAHPNYALARRAEGLDSVTITPIHAAMLAASMARGDAPLPPYLVRKKINVLGEAYYTRSPVVPEELLTPPQTATIRRGMVEAVKGAEGTARRAALEGLETAMKTGTSGENPPGYDALVIGFAPASSPSIAWAVVAEHAGKAEWEGARITREFLLRVKGLLK